MTRRIIDLSVCLENDVPSDPPALLPRIKYLQHEETLRHLLPLFPGLKADELPGGYAAVEEVQLQTHNGTHLDAPWHFHPTMNGGEPSMTIDEVPLEWCMQSGVKLDFRHFSDGYVVRRADIEAELDRIEYSVQPLDIVLINTRAGSTYGTDSYLDSGCGMGAEATHFLLDRGVRLTGTDGWSWDAPFSHVAKRYAENRDSSIIWEGHKAGAKGCYCHLEKLHNLECLPPFGFTVICFPVKIRGGSAGWTRAVALLDDTASG